jgi:hypothetical protein
MCGRKRGNRVDSPVDENAALGVGVPTGRRTAIDRLPVRLITWLRCSQLARGQSQRTASEEIASSHVSVVGSAAPLKSRFHRRCGLDLDQPSMPGIEGHVERLPGRDRIAPSNGFQKRLVGIGVLPEIESLP